MDLDIALNTTIPFLILIGLGFISRKVGLLKEGDERVLMSFVFYFALPSFFVSNLSQINFTQVNFIFLLAGVIPILIVLVIFSLLRMLFKFSRGTFYLLVLSTVFGNLLFYGIPFMEFAFPGTESLAMLSAASISILAIPVTLALLESYNIQGSDKLESSRRVLKGLSKNPVMVSVLFGVILSVSRITVPVPILNPLNLLGATTVPVATFLLGVFFYGRRFRELASGFKLSLLRMALLPTIALIIATLANLSRIEVTAIVIMHGTPLAIPMIVFCEHYNFYKDKMASLLLISSLLAGIYLNVWLLILGY